MFILTIGSNDPKIIRMALAQFCKDFSYDDMKIIMKSGMGGELLNGATKFEAEGFAANEWVPMADFIDFSDDGALSKKAAQNA